MRNERDTNTRDTKMKNYDLLDYYTGARLGAATREQRDASLEAAKHDGGSGVILIDRRWNVIRADDQDADDAVRCYVA